MKKTTWIAVITLTFGFGLVVGNVAAKKDGVTSAAWQGTPEEAAGRLLDLARTLAGDDSWQNISVGRALYLSGDKAGGEAVFDRYLGKSPDNLVRIARVYAHAGEWDKARPLYEQIIKLKPKAGDWLVETGTFYNLNGDRARAEELFARGFEINPKSSKNALSAAGSYIGLTPRRR